MPSDAKKKQQAKKKEAAKARSGVKKVPNAKTDAPETNGSADKEPSPALSNGSSNGTEKLEVSAEGMNITYKPLFPRFLQVLKVSLDIFGENEVIFVGFREFDFSFSFV